MICKQHRSTDFQIRLIRDERENIFNCTRLRFELEAIYIVYIASRFGQHKHGEKIISLRICILSFVQVLNLIPDNVIYFG